MKTLFKILIFISILMLVFNLTQIEWENFESQKSKIALIGIISSTTAIALIWLLLLAKKIKPKNKK